MIDSLAIVTQNEVVIMQLSMFSNDSQRQRKADYSLSLYDWSQKLKDASSASMQGDFVSDVMPESHIVTYKSGSSAKTDLLGYMAAGANIGICATDASKPVLSILASYVSSGGRAFMDSGAFRNFKAKMKNPDTPPVDFDVVLSRYEDVLSQCTSSCGLIVVAPDIVGQQAASYALLEAYKDRITSLHVRGASIMVPLQKGEESLETHYYRCKALLGFDFICGLPSNAKAVSREEVLSFLDIRPSTVHFLGTAESSLVHEAQFRSPRTHFSCDATLIRKHIGKNRLLTEMQRQITEDVVGRAINGERHSRADDIARWDETEVLGDLLAFIDILSHPEQKRFAERLNTTIANLHSFDGNDALWAHLNEVNYGYAECKVTGFVRDLCAKFVSPKVRRSVVSELSTLNII